MTNGKKGIVILSTIIFILVGALVIVGVKTAILGAMLDIKDNSYAACEVTTPTGGRTYLSSHRDSYNRDGLLLAARFYPIDVTMAEGEEVVIHFFCKDCGYDETLVFDAPFSHTFCCNCTGSDETKLPEYSVVNGGYVSQEEEEASSEATSK